MRDNEYHLEEMDLSEYTSSITGSTDPMSGMVENNILEGLLLIDSEEKLKSNEKPKRGRKPLRPLDPIRTKTEEKDKFWLRAFRSYMGKSIDLLWKSFSNEEKLFWKLYFSSAGKPGKKKRFLSYGKKYKMFLFECSFFKEKFIDWFNNFGQTVLEKRYKIGSNEWFVYYNYCEVELCCYNHNKSSNANSVPCPVIDFTMADDLMSFDLEG